MTDNIPENKTETPKTQEQEAGVSSQQKVDANLTQPATENKEQDTQEDPNWRAFREARKRDRAEKEAAEKRAKEKDAENAALKAAMEAAFSKVAPAQVNQSYGWQDQPEETEDERIEKKVQAAIAQREAAAEKARREREQTELPQRLAKAYPDYNQVINEENGAYLEYHHPELYRSLLRQPENFDTCSDIYHLVKKFVPNATTGKKEAARAEANFNKPRSISSTGLTQNTEAASPIRLSDDRKAQNWERMQKLLKGIS